MPIINFELDNLIGVWKEKHQDLYDQYKKNLKEEKSIEKILKFFIDNGADVNSISSKDDTILVNASHELIPFLLENGADINKKNNDGETALIKILKKGLYHPSIDFKKIETLLKYAKDIDLDAQDNNSDTALMIATRQNREEVVAILLEHGANVDLQNNYEQTALMMATNNNNEKILHNLLLRGADIDISNIRGNTALMVACKEKHKNIIEILLNRGADINKYNNEGDTILLEAITNDDIEFIEYLVGKGADVNLANKYTGVTPLIALSKRVDDI